MVSPARISLGAEMDAVGSAANTSREAGKSMVDKTKRAKSTDINFLMFNLRKMLTKVLYLLLILLSI